MSAWSLSVAIDYVHLALCDYAIWHEGNVATSYQNAVLWNAPKTAISCQRSQPPSLHPELPIYLACSPSTLHPDRRSLPLIHPNRHWVLRQNHTLGRCHGIESTTTFRRSMPPHYITKASTNPPLSSPPNAPSNPPIYRRLQGKQIIEIFLPINGYRAGRA